MLEFDHPFLFPHHHHLQIPPEFPGYSPTHILITDSITGVDLLSQLQTDKRFSHDRTRFYSAEIAIALNYIHMFGLHYDLKPQFILLANDGHLLLTDSGWTDSSLNDDWKRDPGHSHLQEYDAPEVLEGQICSQAANWWSFGTIIFEMLTGLPPFYDQDVTQMCTNIMECNLKIPEIICTQASNVIKKLLIPNPSDRLQDFNSIQKDPFFESINFDLLLSKEIIPPFIPESPDL